MIFLYGILLLHGATSQMVYVEEDFFTVASSIDLNKYWTICDNNEKAIKNLYRSNAYNHVDHETKSMIFSSILNRINDARQSLADLANNVNYIVTDNITLHAQENPRSNTDTTQHKEETTAAHPDLKKRDKINHSTLAPIHNPYAAHNDRLNELHRHVNSDTYHEQDDPHGPIFTTKIDFYD